jgi:GH43 family beta-xylosidase
MVDRSTTVCPLTKHLSNSQILPLDKSSSSTPPLGPIIGLLELVGSDPMNPGDWRKESSGCVFYQNPSEQAYGVGHASFVQSEDGSEDWIVYHGMGDPSNGWGARTIRTQKFTWAEDGKPAFPRPGYGPYTVPSGAA